MPSVISALSTFLPSFFPFSLSAKGKNKKFAKRAPYNVVINAIIVVINETSSSSVTDNNDGYIPAKKTNITKENKAVSPSPSQVMKPPYSLNQSVTNYSNTSASNNIRSSSYSYGLDVGEEKQKQQLEWEELEQQKIKKDLTNNLRAFFSKVESQISKFFI